MAFTFFPVNLLYKEILSDEYSRGVIWFSQLYIFTVNIQYEKLVFYSITMIGINLMLFSVIVQTVINIWIKCKIKKKTIIILNKVN